MILFCTVLHWLQLLSSKKTRAWMGISSTPGHVCMVPGGKAQRFQRCRDHESALTPLPHGLRYPHQGAAGKSRFHGIPGRKGSEAIRKAAPWQCLGSSSSAGAPKRWRKQSSSVVINLSLHPWKSLALCCCRKPCS